MIILILEGEWKGGKYLKREYILFAEEKKNREGKGGKYLEKGNIFCREEEKGKPKNINALINIFEGIGSQLNFWLSKFLF